MKQLILHVGLHKTASSSIQLTLVRNSAQIFEQTGYHYPVFQAPDGGKFKNHSIPIRTYFKDTDEAYGANIRDGRDGRAVARDFEVQVAEVLRKYDRIILSAEGISKLTRPQLERLRDHFGQCGHQLRVIGFVRSPYADLCSKFQQNAKAGNVLPTIKMQNLSPTVRISNLLSVFPDAEFFPFLETVKHPNGPVGCFLELLSVDEQNDFSFAQSNLGASNESVRLLAYINKKFPIIVDGRLNPLRKFKCKLSDILAVDGDKYYLTQSEFEELKDYIDYENDQMERLLNQRFLDREFPLSKPVAWDKAKVDQILGAAEVLPFHIQECIREYFNGQSISIS